MKMTKNILIYSILAGLFATPFIAFIVPNAMFFPFITGKGFTFRILIEIIFGLYVVLAFLDKEYRPKLSWVTKSVLFFAVAMLLADLFSANVYKSLWSNYERMEGFVLIAHLVIYYITLSSMFKTTSRWNQFFNTTLFASVMMSFYGVLQLAGKAVIHQGGVRLDATFGNAAYLAIYIVLHIFLALYLFLGDSIKPWQKWAYGLIALFETVILYFTATRGAILGFVGGLFLAGLIVLWKERQNKTLRKMSIGVVAGIVILVVGFMAVKNTSFVKNSMVLSRFSTLSTAELETQGRYFVWPMAVKGFLERPILGWGQESFNYVFNKYYDPRMYAQEQWFDRTHDIFLDWLIAGGLVGFIAYFSMYFAMFYYIWRKQSVMKLSEKAILTGMVSAYIFHNIFVFDNLISYLIFFAFLAYVHSVSTTPHVSSGKFYSKVFSNDAINYAVFPVVIILTLGTVYFVNIPALFANQTLIQAISPAPGGAEQNLEFFNKVYDYNSFGSTEATEQLVQTAVQISSNQQAPNTIKEAFYNLAKEKIEAKVKETPHDARYLVFAGSFFNHFAQYDEGIKYLTPALVESPGKQPIYFELGTSYIGKKDFAKASELFKKAYDLEPDSPESKIVYTLGAIYTQDAKILKDMSTKIDPSVIVSDNRFLRAYTDVGDYSAAISILTTRLANNPKDLQTKFTLASLYASLGQKQKAISLIREMIAQDPTLKTQGEAYIKQVENS